MILEFFEYFIDFFFRFVLKWVFGGSLLAGAASLRWKVTICLWDLGGGLYIAVFFGWVVDSKF
jgi:hypothetical protein